MTISVEEARAWMEQWRSASVALAEQRAGELRRLTPAEALAASEALLSLADPASLPEERRSSSGLVQQQATLQRHPR